MSVLSFSRRPNFRLQTAGMLSEIPVEDLVFFEPFDGAVGAFPRAGMPATRPLGASGAKPTKWVV